MGRRLELELIPAPNWGRNVRAVLTDSEWDVLRKRVYHKAGYCCEICDDDHATLHCHEVWEYNQRVHANKRVWDRVEHVQKLIGFKAVCSRCHDTIHFGRAVNEGRQQQVTNHLIIINGLTKTEAAWQIKSAFDRWTKRSRFHWTLDLSYLERIHNDL